MNHFFKYLSLCLFSFSLAEALSQENPALPNATENGLFFNKENFLALKGGYLGDVSWKAHYKTEDVKSIDNPAPGVNRFKSKRSRGKSQLHLGRLSINILNQVEAYGFIGAMKTRFSHVPLVDQKKRKYKTPYHPAWGGGLRIIGFYWKSVTLGLDGKYLFSNLPIKSIRFRNRSVATDGHWDVRRWQVSGAFSYQICSFVPYVGARYSEVNDRIRQVSKAQLPFDAFKIKNRQRIGGTVGLGFSPGNYYTINVEWRFYDERAVAASLDIKF